MFKSVFFKLPTKSAMLPQTCQLGHYTYFLLENPQKDVEDEFRCLHKIVHFPHEMVP